VTVDGVRQHQDCPAPRTRAALGDDPSAGALTYSFPPKTPLTTYSWPSKRRSLRPRSESEHASVAAISQQRETLVQDCAKVRISRSESEQPYGKTKPMSSL